MTRYINESPARLLLNLISSIVRDQLNAMPNASKHLDHLFKSIIRLQRQHALALANVENNTHSINAAQTATVVYKFLKAENALQYSHISDEVFKGLVTLLSQPVTEYDSNTNQTTLRLPLCSALFNAIADSDYAVIEPKYFMFREIVIAFNAPRFQNVDPAIIVDLNKAVRRSILQAITKNNLPELIRIFCDNSAAKGYLTDADYALEVSDKFGQSVPLINFIVSLDETNPFPAVAILCESHEDWEKIKEITSIFAALEIQYEAYLIPEQKHNMVRSYVTLAQEREIKSIIVGCTGTAKLATLCAANAILPVVGIPLSGGSEPFMKGHDALKAMIDNEDLVTVGVDQFKRAALHVAKTFAQSDPDILQNLVNFQHSEAEKLATAQKQMATKQEQRMLLDGRCSPILPMFEGPNGSLHSGLTSILAAEAEQEVNSDQPSLTVISDRNRRM